MYLITLNYIWNGGYASFPICIAASILRVKFIIYENNLVIGKANKYLLPYAKKILVSYNSLEGVLEKYKYKVVEIGNIIKKEIIHSQITKNPHSQTINILVLGGSQAAKIFAEVLPKILKNVQIWESQLKFITLLTRTK